MPAIQQVAALKHALDAAALRHSLLAANLANLHTPGYARRDLDFERALHDLSVDPKEALAQGGAPSLQKEMSGLMSTDSFYAVCSKALSMRYQMMHTALKER